MIFDSHMHSKFSTDSNMNLEDAINTSKNQNLGIIITEHIDFDYPVLNEFKCDVDSYFNEYEKFRSNTVGLGIEFGLSHTPSTIEKNNFTASNYDFDFVLGSIHIVEGVDIYSEYSKATYHKYEYFKRYLDYMLKCINLYDNFDALSHIDYLCRYAPFSDNELLVSDYKDIFSQIFITLINKGKVLELNSARLNNKTSINSLLEIYSLYNDLGGKYVTLGSDAHRATDIGRNFKTALDMIDHLNLKGVYFKNRKMELF